MIKKITASILALTMVFSTGVLTTTNLLPETAISASAAYTFGDYQYEIKFGNVADITAYTGTSKNVVIPSKIVGGPYDGATVFSINGGTGFNNNKTIESVTIPDSVEIINNFNNCSNLKNVKLGKGLTTIQLFTFYHCTSLTDIVIPNNVTFIDSNAFEGCTALKNITLSKGMKVISANTFDGCTSLENITIPSNIETIKNSAFLNCTKLKTITIPKTVTKIDKYALGYKIKPGTRNQKEKISGFKILCYKGSAAETYAKENGIAYECLDATKRKGDINGDNKIDISDVSTLINHVNGVKSLSSAQIKLADVNGDNKVDVQDASKIVNHINGVKSLY